MKKKKEEVYMRLYRILCEKYVYINYKERKLGFAWWLRRFDFFLDFLCSRLGVNIGEIY